MNFREIADSIRRKLEGERCRTHNEHPKLTVTGSSDKPEFHVTACCETFAEELKDKFVKQMEFETEKAVNNELKNMFKGFGR